MIGISVHSVLSSDWHFQSVLFAHPVPVLPLDKTYPTWGTHRVFKRFFAASSWFRQSGVPSSRPPAGIPHASLGDAHRSAASL
jgi:hypothetical protein